MAPHRTTSGGRKYTHSSASLRLVNIKEKEKEDREFARAAVKSILKEGKRKHHSGKRRTHEDTRDATLVVQEAGSGADSLTAADSYDDAAAAGLEGLDDMGSIGGDARLRSDSDVSMGTNSIPAPISTATATTLARLDTFKTEFHPHSGCTETVESFSVYRTRPETTRSVIDDEPWQPFSCRADFEFAKLTHNAALSKDQTNDLLKLIWRVAGGHTKFTFKTHNDVTAAWTRASCQMTPFEKHVLPVEYKKENIEYEVYSRPLWDWALDLLDNPLLAPHFVWDTQRVYKHDGVGFECFFHKPWTGDRWWNLQWLKKVSQCL
ncbi:uncharacterized protein F5891DRAFT_1191931 [Suillus fuscotomentosus]|uniref:Uncharacterized protein n=1 Tax=Suillus fuscotomentosus TaxID=1912939 RepID=A0AAD4E0U0_9AGAM|nr:uncharacterized protein F5891DRAFT_1191931 [Suillus fuscotomentosus]KAG1897470.1 hypothetical protein F5891DRAFT_1191931 [Suillus fuscotomentosus]